MVTVSCAGKFHAFALAEQLNRHKLLSYLLTTFAYQKNTMMRPFAGRVDKEDIPPEKIKTYLPGAVGMKLHHDDHLWNDMFDKWAVGKIGNPGTGKVFIGWSGMSLRTMRRAKADGKITVIERGSSHIQYQDNILHEEFNKFGIDFHVDQRTIEKELIEYEEADYISIPSTFVKNSFLEMGVPEEKLVQNPYGTSSHFKKVEVDRKGDKFRILYMGSLLIRKGLIYLFEALKKLDIPKNKLEILFVGKVDDEIKPTIEKYKQDNWNFLGHVNHYELPNYISSCDVAVQPSLEEGLSMVMPQMMGCGVPVIATTNTGGEDVIEDGKTGFIVPIRQPEAIAEKIQLLFENPEKLAEMKSAAGATSSRDISWNAYGDRYADFIRKITA